MNDKQQPGNHTVTATYWVRPRSYRNVGSVFDDLKSTIVKRAAAQHIKLESIQLLYNDPPDTGTIIGIHMEGLAYYPPGQTQEFWPIADRMGTAIGQAYQDLVQRETTTENRRALAELLSGGDNSNTTINGTIYHPGELVVEAIVPADVTTEKKTSISDVESMDFARGRIKVEGTWIALPPEVGETLRDAMRDCIQIYESSQQHAAHLELPETLKLLNRLRDAVQTSLKSLNEPLHELGSHESNGS